MFWQDILFLQGFLAKKIDDMLWNWYDSSCKEMKEG